MPKTKVMFRCPHCKVVVGAHMSGDVRVLNVKGHPKCKGANSPLAYLDAEWVNVSV